jgi:hypothetical protein
MTAAQKTAKAKFKQAIAYRQKTGVSLKEAFAHIYGKKKVGIIKKKVAPKKKVGVVNKKYTVSQLKKIANNAAYATGGDLDKMTYRLLDKDYTDKLLPMYLKSIKDHEEKYNTKLGSTKLNPKKSAKKKIGYSKIRLKQEKGITKVLKNTPRTLFPYTAEEKIVKAGKKYFDEQAKKISGFNKSLYNDIDSINNRIYKLKGIILDEKWSIKNAKKIGYSTEQINMAKHFIAQNTKAIKELQIHLKELKKII